jgi:pimeloyl-ACP methyl ester carboxylesterase
MKILVTAAVLLTSQVVCAAVPEVQPTDATYPNHRSYVYGSDAQPYDQTVYRENPFISVDDYHVFTPRAGSQPINSAPVVIFIHGFGLGGPAADDKLIRHLTRSGMSVVYPAYLGFGNLTNFNDWVNRTYVSVQRALVKLDAGRVPVQRNASGRKKLAFVAHSIGTYVATFVAEKAADEHGIPEPLAMLFTDPAGYDNKSQVGIDMSRISDIDPATDVVLLSANDTLLKDGQPASHTQFAVRDFVTELPVSCDHLSAWVVASDSEAGTRLVSDHNTGPQSHEVFDAVDWWGYWPHISAHLKHAFWGSYADFLHDGRAVFSGTWRNTSGTYIRDIAPKFAHPQYARGSTCPPASAP